MLSKCCCCIPLRIGSIILAVLGILQGIYHLVISGEQWSYIIPGILVIILSGCLLIGAFKYHGKEVLVSLVMEGALIVVLIIIFLVVLANIDSVALQLACFWICNYNFNHIKGEEFDKIMQQLQELKLQNEQIKDEVEKLKFEKKESTEFSQKEDTWFKGEAKSVIY